MALLRRACRLPIRVTVIAADCNDLALRQIGDVWCENGQFGGIAQNCVPTVTPAPNVDPGGCI